MKSNLRHIFTDRWARRLASDVEQAFFRIERERRWLGSIINACIAGGAVAFVAWLVTQLREGDVLLFACLGSSAAAVVFAPLSKYTSLRTIGLAYLLSAVTCVLLFPLHKYQVVPLPLQCFLAVALPVFAMRILDAMHPAAIGSALAFIIYDRDITSLMLLLVAILGLLTLVKVMAYLYLEDLEFRHFGKEFRREYYGREITVTVVEPTPVKEAPDD